MKKYHVKVAAQTLEIYEVEAEDALAAAFQAGVDHATRGLNKPCLAVVSVRHGLVEEVRANHPLHVLIEDWDGTEVRPSHDPMLPERMLPGEEAKLTHFFQPATDQGE